MKLSHLYNHIYYRKEWVSIICSLNELGSSVFFRLQFRVCIECVTYEHHHF